MVPDAAEVYYYIRHPDAETLKTILDRVMLAADGVAMGTGTEVSVETTHGNHSLLPNEALATAMHRNLSWLGGFELSEIERQFANEIQSTLGLSKPVPAFERMIQPMKLQQGAAQLGARVPGHQRCWKGRRRRTQAAHRQGIVRQASRIARKDNTETRAYPPCSSE